MGATAGLRQVLGALLFPVQNCPPCAARFGGEKPELSLKLGLGIGPAAGSARLGRAVGPQPPIAGRQRQEAATPRVARSKGVPSCPAAQPRAGPGRAVPFRARTGRAVPGLAPFALVSPKMSH